MAAYVAYLPTVPTRLKVGSSDGVYAWLMLPAVTAANYLAG